MSLNDLYQNDRFAQSEHVLGKGSVYDIMQRDKVQILMGQKLKLDREKSLQGDRARVSTRTIQEVPRASILGTVPLYLISTVFD